MLFNALSNDYVPSSSPNAVSWQNLPTTGKSGDQQRRILQLNRDRQCFEYLQLNQSINSEISAKQKRLSHKKPKEKHFSSPKFDLIASNNIKLAGGRFGLGSSGGSSGGKQLLNKTDMILMQKETEKLARDTLSRLSRSMASPNQENDVIFEWCCLSVQTMLGTLSMNQVKTLSRHVRDFILYRKGSSGGEGSGSASKSSHLY